MSKVGDGVRECRGRASCNQIEKEHPHGGKGELEHGFEAGEEGSHAEGRERQCAEEAAC